MGIKFSKELSELEKLPKNLTINWSSSHLLVTSQFNRERKYFNRTFCKSFNLVFDGGRKTILRQQIQVFFLVRLRYRNLRTTGLQFYQLRENRRHLSYFNKVCKQLLDTMNTSLQLIRSNRIKQKKKTQQTIKKHGRNLCL